MTISTQKILWFFIAGFFVLFASWSCTKQTSKSQLSSTEIEVTPLDSTTHDFRLEYSNYKAHILIKNKTFTHTRQEHFFAPQSVSAVPDSIAYLLVHDQVPLNDEQLTALKKEIRSGFLNLHPEYGAPAEKRHYPSSIKVMIDGKEKTVIHRSHPAYDLPPREFQTLEKCCC